MLHESWQYHLIPTKTENKKYVIVKQTGGLINYLYTPYRPVTVKHVMQLILSRNISLWCRKKKARRYQLKGGNDQERKRIKGQHTSQQTEDWATGTPQKIGDGIRCSGKVSSSWSTSGTCYCYETNVMWYGNRVGHHKYKSNKWNMNPLQKMGCNTRQHRFYSEIVVLKTGDELQSDS